MTRFHGLVAAWTLMALAACLLAVDPAQAGRRHRGCGAYGGCNTGTMQTCGVQTCAMPAPQPETITKTIMVPETYYETVTVPVSVRKPVTRTKTITVYRMVPKTREVNRTVTEYVNVPQTRTEKFVTYRPEWKDVSREVTVMTPQVETREGVRHVCRPVIVDETRTVCRDQGAYETRTFTSCGGCVRTCQVWVPNIVHEEVTVQVCRPQMQAENYTYNVTVCKPVTQKQTFKVCQRVPEEQTREVQFVSVQAQQVEKTFTETYTERVAEEKEVSFVEMQMETEQREIQVAKSRMVPKEVTYTVYPNGCHQQYGCNTCR